jgi:hypothetical protein
MFTGFGKSQLTSLLWPVTGLLPALLSSGNTVNTYSVSPQPAAGIDTWDGGNTMYNNVILLAHVGIVTGGTLTLSLRDAKAAITTANGDASTYLVGTLATISEPGLYYAEFQIGDKIFDRTYARVLADADNEVVRRHHSVRAVAAGGNFTFGVELIYGFNKRDYPVQAATELALTWVAA